ncbi:MAG: chemotaxis protein CheX [Desulfobacterota bacterium]|nr:chemotaxis protein CheX [Thermodesulfobacteriota bacterium]
MDTVAKEKLRNAVEQAVSATIENMAFTVAEPLETPPQETSDMIGARLPVLKPYAAELRLAMPVNTAQALAQELYSVTYDDITPDMLHDIAGEFLNMIAGAIIRSLLPQDTPFQLGLPVAGSCSLFDSTQTFTAWGFSIDGNELIILTDERLVTAYTTPTASDAL